MNAILRTQVATAAMDISRGSFTENTIRSLFGLIREVARNGSWTREIGDFLAHPERNRGRVFSRVVDIVKNIDRAQQGLPYSIEIAPTEVSEVLDDLDAELLALGLPTLPLKENVSLVLLSALQGTCVRLSRSRMVSLHLLIPEGNTAELCGFVDSARVVFPLFTTHSDDPLPTFMPIPGEPDWPILSISFINGQRRLAQLGEPITGNFPES